MQAKIHPKIVTIPFTCSCGATGMVTGAYHEESINNEKCPNCHSAWTGKHQATTTLKVEAFTSKYKDFSGKIRKNSGQVYHNSNNIK